MDLEIAKRALETGIAFVANCGLKVVELRRGYVKCLVPFDGNGNHVGTMYAGALFTVAEIPGGALFLSSFDTRRYYPIVKSLDLRFVKPAKSDVTIEIALDDARIAAISAEADAKGKAEFILDGEIKTADGTVVATSHGVYQLRAAERVPNG
ncbi:MAG: YiiD C-terminal domain-containing protein [Candidatus Binatia bacterium]